MNKPGTVSVRAALTRRHRPRTSADPGASYVRVDVEDEGPGIAPDILGHVFKPFFTTKDVGEGTGWGCPCPTVW